jgi:hypothetical protein
VHERTRNIISNFTEKVSEKIKSEPFVRQMMKSGHFLRIRPWGGGGGGGGVSTKKNHTILSVGRWQMVVGNKMWHM